MWAYNDLFNKFFISQPLGYLLFELYNQLVGIFVRVSLQMYESSYSRRILQRKQPSLLKCIMQKSGLWSIQDTIAIFL